MILLRVLALAVATGFCISAARAIVDRLLLASRGAAFLAGLLVFSALQSLLILAAGLSGLLSCLPLTLVCGAAWIPLLLKRPSWSLRWPADAQGRVLLAFGALAAISLLLKAFLLSPATGDALQYHLPKIAEWIQAGRFVWRINHDPRMWFAGGFELIETWWVVFLHHDALIELGGLQMALLAASAVYVLAEAFEVRPGLAAILYTFIPVVLLNATSCGNDLASAALILSGYALVAAKAPRPLQAFPLLLVLGVKATGGFAALGVVVYGCVADRPPKLSRGWCAALIGAGGLLAAFWYIRNFMVAGHPLYPFRGSHGEFTWTPQQGGVDIDSLQTTLQALPRRLLDRFPYESLSPNSAGWGWALFALGLPATLLALREDRRFRPLAGSFLVGALATLACVWDDGQNYRFILWFPALLALGLARQRALPWVAAALLLCTVNFAATLVPYELRHSKHIQAPTTQSPDAPVACIFSQVVPSYRLYNPNFSRRVTYPTSMEELRKSGAKVVYLYTPEPWAREVLDWPSLGGKFYEVR